MFNQTINAGRTLFRAQVRSVEGQAATLHIGQKFPVITQQYAGSVPAGTQGTVYAPPPSFTYEDLGVEVKVTPYIHGLEGVTLAVETSFQLLAGSSVNGIPIIGRRQFNTQIRLRDNEWAVVAGLKNPSFSKTTSGFWGLDRHTPAWKSVQAGDKGQRERERSGRDPAASDLTATRSVGYANDPCGLGDTPLHSPLTNRAKR